MSLPTQSIGNWDSITICFWAKAPEYSGFGWPSFFGSHTTSLSSNTCIAISRNSGTLHLEIDTDMGNYETNGSLKIPWDNWFHAALVYDGSTLTEYINGEAGTSIAASGNLKNLSEFDIGQLGNNRYFFSGAIDEAFIYNRALFFDEIQSLYELHKPSDDGILTNRAAEKSVLSMLLDKKYVPIAATGTSIVFLFLWNMFGNTVVEFFFDFSSEKMREKKKKEVKDKKSKEAPNALTSNICKKELYSIVFAVLVFSVALSWSWSADLNEFFSLFFINLLVVGSIFLLREYLRIHYSSKQQFSTQHVFWPFGAVLTLASTLLGNTFSLASYTIAEDESVTEKVGKMHFMIFVIIYSVCVLSFLLHQVISSVFLQMIFVFCIMSLFIDLTPLQPMDGYDIKQWDFKKWLMLYVIIGVSYVVMNFSLYA